MAYEKRRFEMNDRHLSSSRLLTKEGCFACEFVVLLKLYRPISIAVGINFSTCIILMVERTQVCNEKKNTIRNS